MIERTISDLFQKIGRTWNLKGGRTVIPTDNDVEEALDEAARILYNEPIGHRLEIGGLIIEKRPQGHDVYVLVGNYQ